MKIKKYKKVILYLLFGVATTIVNWIIYILLTNIAKIDIIVANGGAWMGAVMFAYFTNRNIVFQSRVKEIRKVIKEIFLFVGARGVSGVFEIFLPTVLYYIGINQSFVGIKGFWAKVVTSVLVIVLNYIFSNLIIFKK